VLNDIYEKESTFIGRIDAVWKLPDMHIVTETKYSVEQPLDKASK
jgi:hypothetical protein